ncbi:uncharacterized protein [Epargyreus clarus]|uniref:uncharacterized protein n=1 Tax=Epargyreus clarus TaxID=520877 RepID=UPI003C2EA841
MELLYQSEIESIVKKCGCTNIDDMKWNISDYSNELIGYLGEHLNLTVKVISKGVIKELHLFLKCIPRFNKWKAEYLRETTFFLKEYAMLSGLFQHFQDNQGERKWRPTLLYVKEELFVFEDVSKLGYVMPDNMYTLTDEELMATVEALAKFHAQSYIYEETKTRELKTQYRIWEEYGEYLTEPIKGKPWRDTGMRAAIDYLKEYSAYKSKPGFCKDIERIITMLFDSAMDLMKPSLTYRNVVIHRDIWTNNIFLKKMDSGKLHALIVDFQTVLYCSPMLDLSSLLFFNTTEKFRHVQTDNVLNFYYKILGEELKFNGIDVCNILDKDKLRTAYNESVIFGMTQAALIVPIITMRRERRKEIYGDHERAIVDSISRSKEFIETARDDVNYRNRVTELLDDIVEKFVYPYEELI